MKYAAALVPDVPPTLARYNRRLPPPKVTVAVPTLAGSRVLGDCLRALGLQTFQDFEAVVVDNSGATRVSIPPGPFRTIANSTNVGFGAAVNQVIRNSQSPYLAALNDDAIAHPRWLETLVRCADAHPQAGLFASQVHLGDSGSLDSAGMLIASDGSSKQRGHGRPPADYANTGQCLLPSGSAALYRRAMFDQIGLFDESFFLYCEDTDLGLRARWAGWRCAYAPKAVVHHHYSRTAGRASALKAYYVERNRLFLVVKNFPGRALAMAPLVALARYGWHALLLIRGRGSAARYRDEGNGGLSLILLVLRAHWALASSWRTVWRKRRQIRRTATLSPASFLQLLHTYSIGARQVAEL